MTTQVPDEEAREVSEQADAPAGETGAHDQSDGSATTPNDDRQSPNEAGEAAATPARRSASPATLLALALAFFAAAAAGSPVGRWGNDG